MASDAIVRLLLNISDFDKNIKKAKGEIGTFEKGITAMAGKIGSALSGFAAFAGISVTIGDAVKASMEFEKSLSSLRSLTGVTAQELTFFKDEAIRLGSSTTQTASQVVDAFKLIGSQMPELLKNKEALSSVTESAIVLAEAAEIDVPDAAKALTGALNQMGASSSQASEYINILAAASQQGSADIPYLNRAIENAGGAASSVGIQFNELVAAIEAIAPKITDAGSAGTNLRNIFLTLESSTEMNLRPSVVGLSNALENLSAKQLDATELTKMFGKESVTAALALVSEKDKFMELASGITDTNTALEQQRINNDNLAGSVAALQSEWEGFILTMNDSSGTLKTVVDYLTKIVEGARAAFSSLQALDEESYKSGQKAFRSEKVQNAIDDINELEKGGMSRKDALDWEESLVKNLYKRAESLEEKKQAYEEAMSMYDETGDSRDKQAYEQSKEVYMLARNEKQIRDEILDYIEKERQKLEGVNDVQKSLNKETATGAKKKKKPTELQLAAFNAGNWANEEAKGLHNALRKKIDIVYEIQDPLKDAQVKKAEEYTKTIQGIGYAMEDVNSIAQASGNQTVGFITETFSSIAQMIISLNSLAVANGVANAAALPFPANLAAIATVVSTIAGIFSSLPKFADGGIIGGSSFFGDKMVARVNSGEMILNQSQQGRLFQMINSGNSGGNVKVDGEIKVRGKAMYIAIRNYMKSESIKW